MNENVWWFSIDEVKRAAQNCKYPTTSLKFCFYTSIWCLCTTHNMNKISSQHHGRGFLSYFCNDSSQRTSYTQGLHSTAVNSPTILTESDQAVIKLLCTTIKDSYLVFHIYKETWWEVCVCCWINHTEVWKNIQATLKSFMKSQNTYVILWGELIL